jgi:hypothetical protein
MKKLQRSKYNQLKFTSFCANAYIIYKLNNNFSFIDYLTAKSIKTTTITRKPKSLSIIIHNVVHKELLK